MNNTVIAKRDEAPETSDGGLHIPETANKEIKREATILAVGPGRVLRSGKRAPMDFEIGDRILLGNSVSEINHEGVTYLVVKEENIIAKLT